MIRKRFFGLLAFIMMGIALLSCSQDSTSGSSSTWTFKNGAYGYERIEVVIKDGGYPSSFTLYPGDSINVTWDDQGDGFRGGYTYYSYKDSGKNLGSVYAKYYNSIKTVLFTYD